MSGVDRPSVGRFPGLVMAEQVDPRGEARQGVAEVGVVDVAASPAQQVSVEYQYPALPSVAPRYCPRRCLSVRSIACEPGRTREVSAKLSPACVRRP